MLKDALASIGRDNTTYLGHLDITIDGVVVNGILRAAVQECGFVVALIALNADLVPDEIINGNGWYYGKVSTCPRRHKKTT